MAPGGRDAPQYCEQASRQPPDTNDAGGLEGEPLGSVWQRGASSGLGPDRQTARGLMCPLCQGAWEGHQQELCLPVAPEGFQRVPGVLRR